MKVDGVPYRTIWPVDGGAVVEIIDQTLLPHDFVVIPLKSLADAVEAISVMRVRGAPLIGATAAYGMALAMAEDAADDALQRAYDVLLATRPTAINLRWALDLAIQTLQPLGPAERHGAALELAARICDEDADNCRRIGEHGAKLIAQAYDANGKARPVNVLTHCNAGWLATVDWGTALAPIYVAHEAGVPVHVWVDETRPRNQGASLTTWELGQHGVPHTLIVDNVGGHLMQHGMVDMCITGSDRTTGAGDVCNKIGTYLKALAAKDNGLPFYVGLPYSTIDWTLSDGVAEIPIEQRDAAEVTEMTSRDADGGITSISIAALGSTVANYAFDVTPRRLVTGLITERGICAASAEGLRGLYPEKKT